MAITQKNRAASINTPLGSDTLVLKSLKGGEELARLFQFELELVSEDYDIDFDKIIGEKVTISLNIGDNDTRYFNGYISHFVQTGPEGGYAQYQATVVPWLWFLTRTSDCRIFQNKTIPDILEEVFKGNKFDAYERRLSGKYTPWDYCVQYRETDFNFVSRLMEQEGIYYYFKHENGKHTLVLADSPSAHDAYPGYEEIIFRPPGDVEADGEYIRQWVIHKELRTGVYAHTDFNFEKPKANLRASSDIPRQHAAADLEVFDYPGEYDASGDGEDYAKIRIQELQARHETLYGQTDARGICSGFTFTMKEYERKDQNRKYLVVSANHSIQVDVFESGGDAEDAFYECSFSAIDATVPYRPARITPKPIVQGPQTAIIVGPSGETIYTDKYGRVKVQFHWDRHGKSDANSSCWIRVSQNWGGKNWGGSFIPHVGQEVIVSFLEGDPDQPIITGRVYNADQMPPLDLPANKTKSVIRDHGGNHIRMEGAAGKEQIHFFSPFGNSKISIGAKNDEEGIELKTEKNLKVEVDEEGHMHIVKDVDGHFDANVEIKIKGDLDVEHKESFTELTHGVKNETFMGAKHESTLGLKSEYIGGAKHETVHGLKVETFRGKEIVITHGVREKSPTREEIIEENIEKYEKEKKKVKELQEKADKCLEDYEEYHSIAKKLDGEWKEAALKCAELAIKDCQKFNAKANKIEYNADTQIQFNSSLIKIG